MDNKIIKELNENIKNFDIRLLTNVNKLVIDNTCSEKSILIEFNYINYKDNKKEHLVIIKFENFKVNFEIGLDIQNILNINKLSFEDISSNYWEGIDWLVTDSDDDGIPSFSFYCKDIYILNIT